MGAEKGSLPRLSDGRIRSMHAFAKGPRCHLEVTQPDRPLVGSRATPTCSDVLTSAKCRRSAARRSDAVSGRAMLVRAALPDPDSQHGW